MRCLQGVFEKRFAKMPDVPVELPSPAKSADFRGGDLEEPDVLDEPIRLAEVQEQVGFHTRLDSEFLFALRHHG